MNLVIIQYNAGNLASVKHALGRLGITPTVSDDPEVIRAADKVIFPGVGEASTAMNYLKKAGLDTVIPSLTQPFLGICLGLQLMCKHSEENDTPCLGVFDAKVRKFEPKLKVPHIGWNNLLVPKAHPLLKGLSDMAYVYFVHSYYADLSSDTIATSDYINEFSAVMHRDNFLAIQAHPEKSGDEGMQILKNFLEYEG
ncbi:MAG: imidazole glycerol phosphate synthase subunit HisH [Bacteroidota bacterium]